MTKEQRGSFSGGDSPRRDELDSLLQGVVEALRAPVEPSPDFETRVMRAVREPKPERELTFTPWWRRQSIRLTPLAATALAAGLAFVAYVGGRTAENVEEPSASASAALAPPRAQVVRFVFVDPNAHQVAVVGTFNQWRKDATPLRATGVPGVWSVSVPLTAGMHEYAFVIDGERWAADPLAPAVTDEFGTESSIIRIQGPTSS